MTRATQRIDLDNEPMAEQLMQLLEPCRHFAYANREGNSILLDDRALEALSELEEDHDGYYDGEYIWIGGEAYEIY